VTPNAIKAAADSADNPYRSPSASLGPEDRRNRLTLAFAVLNLIVWCGCAAMFAYDWRGPDELTSQNIGIIGLGLSIGVFGCAWPNTKGRVWMLAATLVFLGIWIVNLTPTLERMSSKYQCPLCEFMSMYRSILKLIFVLHKVNSVSWGVFWYEILLPLTAWSTLVVLGAAALWDEVRRRRRVAMHRR